MLVIHWIFFIFSSSAATTIISVPAITYSAPVIVSSVSSTPAYISQIAPFLKLSDSSI